VQVAQRIKLSNSGNDASSNGRLGWSNQFVNLKWDSRGRGKFIINCQKNWSLYIQIPDLLLKTRVADPDPVVFLAHWIRDKYLFKIPDPCHFLWYFLQNPSFLCYQNGLLNNLQLKPTLFFMLDQGSLLLLPGGSAGYSGPQTSSSTKLFMLPSSPYLYWCRVSLKQLKEQINIIRKSVI
jgi:hypothetical protein